MREEAEMVKIVYLLGKSACGKDTICQRLLADPALSLHKAVLYTTRPMRDGEKEGREYHFITPAQAERLEKSGRVIEKRVYQTVFGPWTYLTVDDGQFAGDGCFLMEGTLESYCSVRDYFGSEKVLPVYIEVEDGERLLRAIARERTQAVPKYREMCRRFIADDDDFSEEKLQAGGIEKRYENQRLEDCLGEIRQAVLAFENADRP